MPAGTRYLTGSQRALLWAVRRATTRGPVTLAALCSQLDTPSRGRTWLQLARLRQLGLIGFRAHASMPLHEPIEPGARGGRGARRFSPGREGRTLVWVPPAARVATRAAMGRRLPRNDSVSTPFGGFCSASGVARAWGTAVTPGSSPASVARAGPILQAVARRSGGRIPAATRRPLSGAPPRLLHVRCALGHRTVIARSSMRRTRAELAASWSGHCRRCQAWTTEQLTIALPVAEPRDASAAERADPELLERRRRIAAELAAEGIAVPAYYLQRPGDPV